MDEFSLLWQTIEGAARENKSKGIEIRTRSTSTACIPVFLTVGSKYKHHYLPLGESTEKLFRSFHDSCVCRRIKKASRAGVVVEARQDEQSLRALHTLMAATRPRLLLPPMPFAFLESMYVHLHPGYAQLYLALDKGKQIGGLMVLTFKDLWIAEYSGYLDDAPPGTYELLYWHAIQQAKAAGASHFSFGRTSLDNTGAASVQKALGNHRRRLDRIRLLPWLRASTSY